LEEASTRKGSFLGPGSGDILPKLNEKVSMRFGVGANLPRRRKRRKEETVFII
jgi:hypothetical protein